MDAFDISASAMTAQRLRLDVIASNLANINTTRQTDGSPGAYRRRNVVFASVLQDQMNSQRASTVPLNTPGFKSDGVRQLAMENGVPTLKASISHSPMMPGAGVKVVEITEDETTPLKQVYDPSHPDADENGYVNMPNINPVTELVDMIAATRAYEANVSSIQATKAFAKAALEI
jgi:flagellar basal-body rod protein FlgC